MRFLYPEILFTLVLVAVPVIVHLFNFRRFKKVYFSNVSLLKKVELQTTGSRQVKRLALLVCRSLAVMFLVLAFARPYIFNGYNDLAVSGESISIYIDNSYSMEAQSKEGTLLEEARIRAKEIVSAQGGNARFQLITNDFEGLHQQLMSGEEFRDAVDTIRISPRSRTIREVLERQKMLFAEKRSGLNTTYFISDFQRNLWDGRKVAGDSSHRYSLLRLKAGGLRNISIDSVWFLSPLHKSGASEQVVVRLKNNSDMEAKDVPLSLSVGRQQKALSSVDIAARKTVLDTLAFSSEGYGWREGAIEIVDNPFTFDDRYSFTYFVSESLPVLIINEEEANTYIKAVYDSDPYFKAEHVGSGHVDYSRLDAYAMIVLPAVTSIREGLAQQLAEYVRRGGALFIFPPQNGELSALSDLTGRLGIDRPLVEVNEEVRVGRIESQHVIFKDVFQSVPKNIDLPVANSYVRYSNTNASGRRALLSFVNSDLFLGSYSVGGGQVFLSAVAATEESSNFVMHSLFVPIMYQAAFLSLRDQPLYYTLGRDQQISVRDVEPRIKEGLRLKSGDIEIIPDVRQTESGIRLFISDQVMKPGVYDLTRGDHLISKVAFNTNPSESDLTFLDNKTLQEVFPDQALKVYDAGDSAMASEIKAANYGVQLWKLCLILSLICLAVEILLLRYYEQKT